MAIICTGTRHNDRLIGTDEDECFFGYEGFNRFY